MSIAAVRSASEFERQLQRYLYERSEEGRAVRVGGKEISEQAAIVARYADLFSLEQLQALRAEEGPADGDESEWLYRLRKTCEGGLVAAELAERDDELENAILAARVEFRGEELPLRSAQARLAVLDSYKDRDELGRAYRDASATFNEERLDLIRAYEELEADLSGEADPVARTEEEKQISLRELESVLQAASEEIESRFIALRDKWFERLLGDERDEIPDSAHFSYVRRLSPLAETYTKDRATEVCLATVGALGFDMAAEARSSLEALLSRRYTAKRQFELEFWSDFTDARTTNESYARRLTESTGLRYHADGHLADMDPGFYSADYLRAWIRHAQLRSYLVTEIGEDWWRSRETGEMLRNLFTEGTRPSSEEIAARLGSRPYDTAPLIAELNLSR